jgi:hypothetical protein
MDDLTDLKDLTEQEKAIVATVDFKQNLEILKKHGMPTDILTLSELLYVMSGINIGKIEGRDEILSNPIYNQ